MTKLVNRAKMTTATTGTGTITLGSAVDGFQTFADAGVANTNIVRYVLEDGSNWEIGLGTYSSTGPTLTRGSIESNNADAAINLSGNAVVFLTAAAADLQELIDFSDTFTLPTTDGTSGQVLTTNGSGVLTFQAAGGGASPLTISTQAATYTVVAADLGKVISCTASFTVNLTAAATLGSGFYCWIWNDGAVNVSVTIDPAGSETIDGASTKILRNGEGVQIVSTGTNWLTGDGRELKGYAEHTRPGDTAPNSSGTWSIALSAGASATGSQSLSFGRNSSASGDTSISIGPSAQANNSRSTAIGSNSGSSASVCAGSGAIALSGSYAGGTDSFAAAISNNSSSYGAVGGNSVAIGYQAYAGSTYGLALGYRASSTANGAMAIGTSGYSAAGPSASAQGSIAIGNTASCGSSAFYSITIGTNLQSNQRDAISLGSWVKNDYRGKFAWSNGNFSAVGDSQSGETILRIDTATATTTALTSNKLAASTENQINLPANSAYVFSGMIVARQAASAGTASAAWKVEGLIRREALASSTTLVASTVTAISNVPGWTVALVADTTNAALRINVTGAASTNIRWVATVKTSEVLH
jgi:hypothetical protein